MNPKRIASESRWLDEFKKANAAGFDLFAEEAQARVDARGPQNVYVAPPPMGNWQSREQMGERVPPAAPPASEPPPVRRQPVEPTH